MQKPKVKIKPIPNIKFNDNAYLSGYCSKDELNQQVDVFINRCKTRLPSISNEFLEKNIRFCVEGLRIDVTIPNPNYEAELTEYNKYLQAQKEYEEHVAATKLSFEEANRERQTKKREALLKKMSAILERAKESENFDIERALSDCMTKLEKDDARFRHSFLQE